MRGLRPEYTHISEELRLTTKQESKSSDNLGFKGESRRIFARYGRLKSRETVHKGPPSCETYAHVAHISHASNATWKRCTVRMLEMK